MESIVKCSDMREDITRTEKEAPKERARGMAPYKPNRIQFLRLWNIIQEFIAGFNFLKKYCLTVTFFGTSRCTFEDEIYQKASKLASILAKEGFTVATGGGNGVMEAANRGAREAGGASIGLNIELPNEQQLNEYLTDSLSFHYFFIRKVMLSFASEVYIFFPGGFGTMDEFFEIITLIQTEKIQPIPVILIGKDYWQPLLSWIDKTMYEENKAIEKDDMKIYRLVDTVEEANDIIKELIPIEKLRAC